MLIERIGDEWRAFWTGAEGKRRPAELAVPADLASDELAGYLYDIYHECATPTNGDVVALSPNSNAPRVD